MFNHVAVEAWIDNPELFIFNEDIAQTYIGARCCGLDIE